MSRDIGHSSVIHRLCRLFVGSGKPALWPTYWAGRTVAISAAISPQNGNSGGATRHLDRMRSSSSLLFLPVKGILYAFYLRKQA